MRLRDCSKSSCQPVFHDHMPQFRDGAWDEPAAERIEVDKLSFRCP